MHVLKPFSLFTVYCSSLQRPDREISQTAPSEVMKINVRTLKGTHFEIQVNTTDTVDDIKKNIETVQGPDVYPTAQQILVHQGKVLKEATTMEENKLVENSFIFVMLRKGKDLASELSTTSADPVNVDQPTQPSSPSHSIADEASAETNAYDQEASNVVAGSSLETTIQQFIEIGGGSWDRETVIRALRAANNNPERAVDYLYSGIPNLGSNATADGTFDFLRNNQQFHAFRSMVQASPEMLQPMLQELGNQNPNLMQLIHQHQADFLNLINEPVVVNVAGQESFSMTPEEYEAVKHLEGLGFDRSLVLEVFVMCDKNEEITANYLIDHMHEFED